MNSVISRAPTAARIVLGLIFFVFGLNGFLNFIPSPPPTGAAATFFGGLAATGYFFPLLKGTEVAAGLLLLGNRWVPLTLVVLAPIVVNIVAFHAFLVPDGIVLALGVLVLELYLAWSHRSAFRPLFARRASPIEVDAVALEAAHSAAE